MTAFDLIHSGLATKFFLLYKVVIISILFRRHSNISRVMAFKNMLSPGFVVQSSSFLPLLKDSFLSLNYALLPGFAIPDVMVDIMSDMVVVLGRSVHQRCNIK